MQSVRFVGSWRRKMQRRTSVRLRLEEGRSNTHEQTLCKLDAKKSFYKNNSSILNSCRIVHIHVRVSCNVMHYMYTCMYMYTCKCPFDCKEINISCFMQDPYITSVSTSVVFDSYSTEVVISGGFLPPRTSLWVSQRDHFTVSVFHVRYWCTSIYPCTCNSIIITYINIMYVITSPKRPS